MTTDVNNKTSTVTSRVFKNGTRSDYERTTVPPEERKGWVPIAGIWIAVGIDISGTILGAQLGAGLSLEAALGATIIGSILLGLLAMACTYVGASTGFTSAMIARSIFGRMGGIVIASAMAISSVGWFGVQAGFFANNAQTAVEELFGWNVPLPILIIAGGTMMTLTAFWGYRALERLSKWAVPLLIGTLLIAVFLAFMRFGGSELGKPTLAEFTFGGAVSLVIGIFIFGVIISPDIARWAKTPRQAMIAGFFGFFVGNSFIILITIILSRLMGIDDLMRMFFILGMGAIAIIVLTLAQWTTNTNNLYSAALNLSVIFPQVARRLLTLIAAVIAISAALLGIYDAFIPFISIMGAFIAPYGGVYLADFFIRRSERLRNSDAYTPKIDGWPFIAWGVGALVGFCTTRPGDGLGWGILSLTTIPALDAIVTAFLIHSIISLLRNPAEKRT
ncbi:cytosine permease [Lysinibacter sp. HNR]|uniref:cytosine permease n=1 Tax=Lysinibacter sp. HNR TaxID=3031408 RepID=UPI0024349B0A|nr:cytosine permease [Lysinibacter sp. HNR]WGD37897.1 cytosine permease [Lysinibacter sp. HNR]